MENVYNSILEFVKIVVEFTLCNLLNIFLELHTRIAEF